MRWPKRGLLLLAVAALAGTGLLPEGQAAVAHAAEPSGGSGPVAITQAPPLTWGFKSSWRFYAPLAEAGDGAVKVAESGPAGYTLQWAFQSGSYDAETETTQLDYTGTAHWLKYPAKEMGYTPPSNEPEADLLDVRISNPRITISRESSVITAEVISREFEHSKTYQLVDYGRVPLEDLEVLNVKPTVEGGTTTWQGIPAVLSEQGNPAFAGFYEPGQVLDEVGFSYTGPGGAPDFSEHFDNPGQPVLKPVENKLFINESACTGSLSECPTIPLSTLAAWVDQKDLLTSFERLVTVEGKEEEQLEAFSLKEMKPLGEPLAIPSSEAPEGGNVIAFDTNKDRLLYSDFGETGITRWVQFDASTDRYETGRLSEPKLSEPSFIGYREGERGLAWDEQLDMGYRISNESGKFETIEEAYENEEGEIVHETYEVETPGEWQLITYKEDEATGEWTKTAYPIPDALPSGDKIDFEAYSSWKLNNPGYATASDGSLVVLGQLEGAEPSGPKPASAPAAYRLILDEDTGTVEVKPLPLEVPNTAAGRFSWVQTAANGQILLTQQASSGEIAHCQIQAGGTVHCDPTVPVDGNVEAGAYSPERFAVDPEDGLVWYAGKATRELAAFGEGKFLGGETFADRNPFGGPIVIGEHHTVYVQTNNGGPSEFGGSKTWGWAKLELLGTTPTVAKQPQAARVSLGKGEASRQVTFSSQAEGEPAPSVQWQVKKPGSPRYTDIEGATSTKLEVTAEPDANGDEYRAVYQNAAGRVASEPAALSVEYAPQINLQPASQTIPEGKDASFSVVANASPAPTVAWQREAPGSLTGLWQTVDDGEDGLQIGQEGDTLTVLDAPAALSGTRFRAVVSNSVGTVESSVATLIVHAKPQIPAGGVEVTRASLDWVGSEEMQTAPPFGGSNYFSAGVSDGTEASYEAQEGDVSVYQISATGQEALATFASRAEHVHDGGEQLVSLIGGQGRIEPGGSATIEWQGSFSVNFYGGLVPFTITDPKLTIDSEGAGELSADLEGCGSSQAEPDKCTPLAPEQNVTIETFHDAEVNSEGSFTITPDYAGVEVEVPASTGALPQDEEVEGWGSWPQPFVDFQFQTGLSSYWYTSGGEADPDKPPLPFVVDVDGPEPPSPQTPSTGLTGPQPQPGPQRKETPPGPSQETKPKANAKTAKVTVPEKVEKPNAKGVVELARISCPDGVTACAVFAKHVTARIHGRRYTLIVIGAGKVEAGHHATLRLKLPKAAIRALGHRELTVKVKLTIRSRGSSIGRLVKVAIQRGG